MPANQYSISGQDEAQAPRRGRVHISCRAIGAGNDIPRCGVSKSRRRAFCDKFATISAMMGGITARALRALPRMFAVLSMPAGMLAPNWLFTGMRATAHSHMEGEDDSS